MDTYKNISHETTEETSLDGTTTRTVTYSESFNVLKLEDINELMELDRRLGQSFFDPVNMRGFNSKVYPDLYRADGQGMLFITSERFTWQGYSEAREYTVRIMTLSGHIKDLDDHSTFSTYRQAQRHAEKYIKFCHQNP